MIRLKKKEKERITSAFGEALELLDWNVFTRKDPCPKCSKNFVGDGRYCEQCGHKLERNGELLDEVHAELWAGFKAAMKEYEKVSRTKEILC